MAKFATVVVLGLLLATAPLLAAEPADETRAAVERGLAILEKGAASYPQHRSCFSCHHQTLPLLAMQAARAAGVKVDRKLFADQAAFSRQTFVDRADSLREGKRIGGAGLTVSYGLWTLSLAEQPADEVTDAMVANLLAIQEADGAWRPQSHRPPISESPVTSTVLAALGLERYARGADAPRALAAAGKARAWLAEAPLDTQEALNFRLWSLHQGMGSDDERAAARKAVLAAQQEDGGWAQRSGLSSDAYATGQTLYLLHATGAGPADAAWRRGRAWLLQSQEADGSWHVKTRAKPVQKWFDNGDPHGDDQFISIAATGWAVAALARSLPSPAGKPNAEAAPE